MPSAYIPNRSAKALFRLFAVSALALAASGALSGCGKKAKDAISDSTKQQNEQDVLKSNIEEAHLQIRNFETALDNYKLDVGSYPASLEHLLTNIDKTEKWNGPYFKSIPKDPWGNDYIYVPDGKHNQNYFDLYSFGPDGKEGGGDDIVNWSEND